MKNHEMHNKQTRYGYEQISMPAPPLRPRRQVARGHNVDWRFSCTWNVFKPASTMSEGVRRQISKNGHNKKQFKVNNYHRTLLAASDGDATRMGDDGGNGDAKGVNCFSSPIATSARSRISSACPSVGRSGPVPMRDSGALAGIWIP